MLSLSYFFVNAYFSVERNHRFSLPHQPQQPMAPALGADPEAIRRGELQEAVHDRGSGEDGAFSAGLDAGEPGDAVLFVAAVIEELFLDLFAGEAAAFELGGVILGESGCDPGEAGDCAADADEVALGGGKLLRGEGLDHLFAQTEVFRFGGGIGAEEFGAEDGGSEG